MVAMLLKVRNMLSVELSRDFAGGRNPQHHRTPRRTNVKKDMDSSAPIVSWHRCLTMWGTLGLFLAVESVMMPFSMGVNS